MVTAWNGNLCSSDDDDSCVVVVAFVFLGDARFRAESRNDLSDLYAGLMISGFARAGAAVRNVKYVELATDAAKFVERHLFDKDKGVLLRSCYRGDDDRIMQT